MNISGEPDILDGQNDSQVKEPQSTGTCRQVDREKDILKGPVGLCRDTGRPLFPPSGDTIHIILLGTLGSFVYEGMTSQFNIQNKKNMYEVREAVKTTHLFIFSSERANICTLNERGRGETRPTIGRGIYKMNIYIGRLNRRQERRGRRRE